MIEYRITRVVNGQDVSSTVLSDNQLDLIYNGLSAITDDIKDEDSPYYDKNDDIDLDIMFNRLYEVCK
jgi:hypothetical protein